MAAEQRWPVCKNCLDLKRCTRGAMCTVANVAMLLSLFDLSDLDIAVINDKFFSCSFHGGPQ